jgi:hypothetical protein
MFASHCYYRLRHAGSTIAGKLAAVRWYHQYLRGVELGQHPQVTQVMRSIVKHTGASKPTSGLFLADIMAGRAAAVAAGLHSLEAVTWRGLLLSFFLLLRSSEIWGYSEGKVNHDFCILVGGVDFYLQGRLLSAAERGLADSARVHIRGSKADQSRRGCTLAVVAVRRGYADPVAVLLEHFRYLPRGATAQHPLMVVAGAKGLRAVTRDEAGRAVKALAALRGLDPALYHTHAMRVGGATTLAHAGVHMRVIKLAGRWRSDAFLIYVRDNMADFARISHALARTVDVGASTLAQRTA